LVIVNELDLNDSHATWLDYQSTCDSRNVQWAFFTPEQVLDFISIAERGRGKPRGATTLLLMGSKISGSEKQRAAELLGSGIIESWGNTEALGTITEVEDLARRPDSVGRPFLTDILMVIDETTDKPVPPYKVGRLASIADGGFSSYTNLPDATGEAKRNGLIISGDDGYMDEEGYLFFRGRAGDAITGSKGKVYLSELEGLIRELAWVTRCCAVPKDPACIILLDLGEDAPSHEECERRVRDRVSECVSVSCVQFSDVPLLASGKIDREACRKAVEDRI